MASAGLATLRLTSHGPRRPHERASTARVLLLLLLHYLRPMLAPCALIPLGYTLLVLLPNHNNQDPQNWSMMDATWFVLKLYVTPLATASLMRRYSVGCCRRRTYYTTPTYEMINTGSSYPYDGTSTALPMQNNGVTSHYDSAFVREEEWYRWTSSQVISWLLEQQQQQQQQQQHHDDWPPGTAEEMIAPLAGEGVDGSILPSLTVEHVRSFGISFGNAVRLVSQIDRLVQTYPNDNNNTNTIRHDTSRQSRQTSYAGGDDILERDGWWSKPNVSTKQQPQQQQQPSSNDTRIITDMDLEEQPHDSNVPHGPDENEERARQIMKDKFGFNLPEMRSTPSSFSQPPLSNDMMSPEQLLTMETGPLPPDMQEIASRRPDLVKRLMELRGSQEQTESSNNNEASALPTPTPTLNPAMVASMPPSIRAIALRRPDLVQDMIALKQSSSAVPAVPAASTSTPGLVSHVQRNMMKKDPDYASRFVGAQAAMNMPPMEDDSKHNSRSMDEQQSMYDSPSKGYYDNDEADDDKAGLLRRRSNR
eukprot:scaffold458340_cov59-Attheya_sp.AAC.1